MGASYRWADWLAAGAPSPIRRRLLRVYGFDNANSWKARQNPARPKTQHETHIRPATPSRRRTKNHVPRVSPCSPASIDQGFVEIGHAQLSQSVKTTNVTHTHRLRLTNNGTLYTPRYEEDFLSIGKKRPWSHRSLGPASLKFSKKQTKNNDIFHSYEYPS